jgi:hypothetical protein
MTKLKQIWFPPEFRLPKPEFAKEQIDLLEELLQLIHPTLSQAEQANRDDKAHMASFLVDLGTGIWRIRRKIEGLTRMPKEIRDALYSLESTWMSMSEGGVEIVDHVGAIPPNREAKVVEVRYIQNLAREQVIEAVKPTILLRGEVIQIGEVVVGRPAESASEAEMEIHETITPEDAADEPAEAPPAPDEPPDDAKEKDASAPEEPSPVIDDDPLSDLSDKFEQELQGTLFFADIEGTSAEDAEREPAEVLAVDALASTPIMEEDEKTPEYPANERTAEAPDEGAPYAAEPPAEEPITDQEGASDLEKIAGAASDSTDEPQNTPAYEDDNPDPASPQIQEDREDSSGTSPPLEADAVPIPSPADSKTSAPQKKSARPAKPQIREGIFPPMGPPPKIDVGAFEASGENTSAAREAEPPAEPQAEESLARKPRKTARKPRRSAKNQRADQDPQGDLSGSTETQEADDVG